MGDDWFRSPAWDPAAQEDFEQRLGRARDFSRPQLLRIKGLALAEAGLGDAARELWLRVVDRYPDDSNALAALEHLADDARERGELSVAADYYRELLRRDPSLDGTSGMAHVSLAELLLQTGEPERVNEARDLLAKARDSQEDSWLNDGMFRWAAARALLGERLGDSDLRRDSARLALSLASRPSEFSRHPGIGVVHPDDDLQQRLWSLAK